MNVSAKDKATGKEQSIVIKASSGLSDDEIEQMVRDAEAHAEEDKKFQEMIEVRNQADGLIHATKKTMEDEKVTFEDGEKEAIEAAIKELEEAMQGDDKAAIEAKTEALTKYHRKMAERMYAQAQAEAQQAQPEAGPADANAESDNANDDVVDAEFEEVKDDKK